MQPRLKIKHNVIGFTLVEISIVLVIIGLVLGGILFGQDLIKSAELRNVGGEVEKFKLSVNTFRVKYNCIPGDCANATDFFGTNTLGCPSGGSTTGTCNGDGNGRVNEVGDPGATFRFWQQLALAGLVSGSFTGILDTTSAPSTWASTPGLNIPASNAIKGTGWTMFYANPTGWYGSGWWNLPNESYTHKFQLGRSSKTTDYLWHGTFTPSEASYFDTKFDDGNAIGGSTTFNYVSYNDGALLGSCITISAAPYVATFVTSSTQKICSPAFSAGF